MFKKTRKAQATQVAEHTFLLCKPDAEQYHRNILQIVADEGFRVIAKSFIITPKQAEMIVKMFPSVRRSRYAEHRVDKVFPDRKAGNISQNQSNSDKQLESTPLRAMDNAERGSSGNSNDGESDSKQGSSQPERSQVIIAEIMQLTKLRCEGGDAVNAGLTKTADDGETSEGSVNGCDKKSLFPPAESIDVQQGCDNAETRYSSAAVLRNRMLENLPYQELLQKHTQHLAFGGTCLAVELVGENAVERLLALVGPENPVDACCNSPNSIRARFGHDLVRNAVHAASNLVEAGECIAAIFGFAPHHATAEVGDQGVSSESPGCTGLSGYMDHGEIAGVVTVRPHCELVFPGLRAPTRGPTTLEATVTVKNANMQAHISYYTGETPLGSKRKGVKGRPGSVTANRELNARDWQQKAKELEHQLAQQQRELAANAKLLRARELDLLLREHELESAVQAIFPPLQSQQGQLQQEHGEGERELLQSDATAAVPLPSVGEGHTGERYLLPFASGRDCGTGADLSFRHSGYISNSVLSRVAPKFATPQPMYDIPPTIEVDDVSLLLSHPVRLRALFMALERSTPCGKVMWEDMEGLYNRSPAVHLLWFEDHRAHFRNYLVKNTLEPLSFHTFVSVIMFLFKQ
ncbi:hypothetical protein, conserved [Trypanosoma brucei gambiense DAL972]|uniref:Nucleoside diphosphate kinase-like domain-containing protein n=1 Tax=Trypanosoma brucei gambiense (strain MHOM/CI/86/DAL972) TaxID=679716 RepID=C9ZVP7_TRYB9|nr:hypothetical protein, conserved [Trypanosoma brucei gambiense DAL972]CBH13485.1 hypothetical protein, conserved [Trypanosoma brucei gambiense DAL972]|eukprot:XP_011775762.1 hypothetical protein, conserved [Trypanosoma brucei gambiense DAL972]